MKKYRCTVCDWIYDPEVGDPEGGIAPERPSKIFPKTGYARFAASARTSSRRLRSRLRPKCPAREHPRSRIADMGRIRRQAASPTCRRPSSTGWRVPFRHQKKGYPVGYPFLYAARPDRRDPGGARHRDQCPDRSRLPCASEPDFEDSRIAGSGGCRKKRAVCNIPPCDSGRNPDQAFPSGFVPGRPAPAFTAGSAPLPRLL